MAKWLKQWRQCDTTHDRGTRREGDDSRWWQMREVFSSSKTDSSVAAQVHYIHNEVQL